MLDVFTIRDYRGFSSTEAAMSATRTKFQAQDEIIAAIKALADKAQAGGKLELAEAMRAEMNRLAKKWKTP